MDADGALHQIPYLRHLPADERVALARSCEYIRVARGAALFGEGDEARGIYLIVSGRIRLVRSSEGGREQVLHEEGPGATLAEVPVFDGGGCVGSAIAVDDAVVLCVPKRELLAALDRSPGSALQVIRILAARLRKFAGMVEDLSLRAVTGRIAAYLVREMETAGGEVVTLPATRDELAAHVGTVREQVSRALTELKGAGIIAVSGREVSIADARRLRVLAGRPGE